MGEGEGGGGKDLLLRTHHSELPPFEEDIGHLLGE